MMIAHFPSLVLFMLFLVGAPNGVLTLGMGTGKKRDKQIRIAEK